jgi:putative phosphoserine phosphatase/1-acylglycerol-3-phosphate O-acyltransferase
VRNVLRAPVDLVRTLATLAAIAPGLAAGVATLATTRDRRRAINRATEVWGDLGTRACGVTLDVTGAERLRLRPAVFVFNHQSGADPFLICALLRRDFVGVAKAEIRRNPVLGPAFAFADTVFVDRFDSQQSVAALAPAIETLRRGLAIAIAPEGTRSRGIALGAFKKGGFWIAMAARVPVIPIVLHNAADVLPRGGWLMRPATVRVTVLEPISTLDWNPANLGARVAEVERRFAAALASGDDSSNVASEGAGLPARSAPHLKDSEIESDAQK